MQVKLSNDVREFLVWRLSEGDTFAQAWRHAWRHESPMSCGCDYHDLDAHAGFPVCPHPAAEYEALYKAAALVWNSERKRARETVRRLADGLVPTLSQAWCLRALTIVNNGAAPEPNRTLDEMLVAA